MNEATGILAVVAAVVATVVTVFLKRRNVDKTDKIPIPPIESTTSRVANAGRREVHSVADAEREEVADATTEPSNGVSLADISNARRNRRRRDD